MKSFTCTLLCIIPFISDPSFPKHKDGSYQDDPEASRNNWGAAHSFCMDVISI